MGIDDYLLGQIADLEALFEEAIRRGDEQNAETLRNQIDGLRQEWESRQE